MPLPLIYPGIGYPRRVKRGGNKRKEADPADLESSQRRGKLKRLTGLVLVPAVIKVDEPRNLPN